MAINMSGHKSTEEQL